MVFRHDPSIKTRAVSITWIFFFDATAVAIHMTLNEKSKDEIKKYIEDNYLKIDTINPQYFYINSVETVKQFIYEDAIRNAIALGGDSDTI